MTFRAWMLTHIKRDDAIGDLARDIAEDQDWPKGNWPGEVYVYYLERVNACEGAIRACRRAYAEYGGVETDRWAASFDA